MIRASLVRRACTPAAALATAIVLAGAPQALAAAPDFLDVLQVNGTTSASSSVAVVPLLSTGTTGAPIALPTAAAGTNSPLTIGGSATSDGSLSRSADGRYLALAGYGTPPGTPAVTGTTSSGAAGVRRVVGRIDGLGNVDTSTALPVFTANNVRGAVTDDGSRFWVTGAGSNDAPKTAMYFAGLGATTAAGLVTAGTGSRVAAIANSQVYLSSDKIAPAGVYKVGTGLPTSGVQTVTALAAAATIDPYGFALVRLAAGAGAPDTLYVADGAGVAGDTGGIRKYSLVGTSWVAEGVANTAVPRGFASLTARASGSTVQIYATAIDGSAAYALTDAAGAATTISGTPTVVASAPGGTVYRGIAFAPTGQVPPGPAPTIALDDSSLGAVLGDPDNPPLGFTLADADPNVALTDLTVTATSSNHAVVADGGLSITGTGAARSITVTPLAKGLSTITLTVTSPDGHSGTTTFTYGASDPAPTGTTRFLTGASDASAAIDVGDGYIVVGDDTSNVLRLYRTDRSGPPVKTWDFQAALGVNDQIDIEAAMRRGDTIYWTGSMGNSAKGNIKPFESTLFTTQVSGSGATTELTLTGSYTNLRNDLIAWDQSNGDVLGFAAGAAAGQLPKQIDGFNVEGMEFADDLSSTAYLGFRAPLEPTTDRHLALVVPVTNFTSLTTGAATTATFGTPMFWDLGGLSVRDIRRNASGQFLVIAGLYAAGTDFELYTWDGNPADQPVKASTLLAVDPLASWEGIVATPDPLTNGSPVSLIEDEGDVDFYGDGSEAKALPLGLRKARLDTFNLALALSFTSAPPSPAQYGGSYQVSATGGGSAPITFSIAAPSAGVCELAADGVTVSFTGVGSCAIEADQAAGAGFGAGHAQQTIDVLPAPLTITAASDSMTYGGTPPTITASYTGFVNADTAAALDTPPTCSTSATPTSAAGSAQTSTCDSASAANYTISYIAGTVTIARAPLTITAADASVTYGAPLPAITASYSGFVLGQASTDLATAPTCSANVAARTTSCSGAVAANYAITYVAGVLTVIPAHLRVLAPSASVIYASPVPAAFTPAYSGLVNGDIAPAVPGTCSTTAVAGDPVGTYAITCSGAQDPNYSITSTVGVLTITRRKLTITASAASMLYGAGAPVVTPIYAGFAAGQDASLLATRPTCTPGATAGLAAGTYAKHDTCSGAASPNFTFTYVAGTLTVTKAHLTITAPSATIQFGAPIPTLAPTYTGLVNGQTAPRTPATCTTTATTTTAPGTRPINCKGAADSNYAITLVAGVLTITKATTALHVQALNATSLHPSAVLTRADSGAAIAGQTIAFSVNGAKICSAVTDATGTARCTKVTLTLPPFTASYAGSAGYTPASST